MTVLLLIALPTIFAMLVWVIVTAYRLLRPDELVPLDEDPVVERIRRLESREPMPVGAQDIREMERRTRQERLSNAPYDFLYGYSDGFPVAWLEDLTLRRN